RTASGQSALVPAAGPEDFTDIQQVLRRLMSSSKVVQEDAKVVILNGTPQNGLAGKNEALLLKRNINVTEVADAKSIADSTHVIVVNSKKPSTLAALKQLYGTHVTSTNPYATKYAEADFIVVLGNDQVASSQ
ncbi:MAG: LytR C-terminal domain-containing protein, partial [Candidatus Saccharibacteria bacterium]|nr:LytR C-terminal domain-containing protein [Candidatus Saccharibacteria bacterium]